MRQKVVNSNRKGLKKTWMQQKKISGYFVYMLPEKHQKPLLHLQI
jgi:hypothetical protein